MKKILVGYIFFILIAPISKGQNSDVLLENLKSPTMPSATIIGTQVSEINQPKSLKALEAALLSNYLDENQNISLPNNYAIELNPFMLSGRKNFDYKEYFDNKPLPLLYRNFSVSLASTNNFMISDSISSNALGLGLRTILYNGNVNEKLKISYLLAIKKLEGVMDIETEVWQFMDEFVEDSCNKDSSCYCIDSLKAYVIKRVKESLTKQMNDISLKELEVNRLHLIKAIEKDISIIINNIPSNTKLENVTSYFLESYHENWSKVALDELKELLREVKQNRYGFRIELNYAHAFNFPTNNFDEYITSRWGLWMNVSYRHGQWKDKKERKNGNTTYKGHPSNFEFIALGRIIKNNDDFINKYSPADTTYSTDNIYDVGIKGVFDYKKFSVSFEYIHRFNRNKIYREFNNEIFSRTENNDTRKYMLSINYTVRDNIVLSYNLGKGFDSPFYDSGNLIAGLTLNFGFGDIKAEDLIKK